MKGVPQVPSVSRTLRDEPHIDLRIRDLAERQHNLVSLARLQFLGLSPIDFLGVANAWPWRPTAGEATERARPSRTTAAATAS